MIAGMHQMTRMHALMRTVLLPSAIGVLLGAGQAGAVSIAQCSDEYDAFKMSAAAYYDGSIPADLNVLARSGAVNIPDLNASTDIRGLNAKSEHWAEVISNLISGPDPDSEHNRTARAFGVLGLCLILARVEELKGADGGEAPQAGSTNPSAPDKPEDRSAPPKPVGNPGQWFAEAPYPVGALREGRSGVVRYEVTVGADGAAAGCQASGPPGSADLELATCETVMARARFTPATDKTGRAVTGEVSGSIRWAIPE